MCLICFLKNDYQYKLRKSACNRSDRFEQTLLSYKRTFISNFLNEKDKTLCEYYENDTNKKIREYINEISNNEINAFFDTIIDIYFEWINSCTSKSIEKFENILNKYNIFSLKDPISDLVLFRGRQSKDLLSNWDMYHIPFNKRYKISNQRYSLVGQPLLYLAKSPYCVINELDTQQDVWISSFHFKANSCREEVFNNTNHFENIIEINHSDDTLKQIDNMMDCPKFDHKNSINQKKIRTLFFHLILSSCCSFSKRVELKRYNFCEEYVLPQILAQILKGKKCKGIMYTSTKSYANNEFYKNAKLADLLSCNICLFTDYDHNKIDDATYVYDHKLYKKFEISPPLSIQYNNYNNIDSIGQIIKEFFIGKPALDNINTKQRQIMMEVVDNLIVYYKVFENENTRLSEDDDKLFKLHCFMISNIILNIRDNIIMKEVKSNGQ